MRVTINASTPSSAKTWVVQFLSEEGEGRGIWVGKSPETGRNYEVEIDVSGDFSNKFTFDESSNAASIHFTENRNHVSGIVDCVYDDGVFALRLDKSIILVKAIMSIKNQGKSILIEVPEEQLRIYDVDI